MWIYASECGQWTASSLLRVVRFRNEALALSREVANLKTNTNDYEYSLEMQSKELTSQRQELVALRHELSAVCQEKEELLERWMKEKRLEARRVNKFNQMQERWDDKGKGTQRPEKDRDIFINMKLFDHFFESHPNMEALLLWSVMCNLDDLLIGQSI